MAWQHDDEKREEAVRLYRDEPDTLLDDIAARVGVSRKTVQRWAREAGLPARPPRKPSDFPPETWALAVKLYLQRPTLRMSTIEARTGMDESTIRTAVVRAGHPLRTVNSNARLDRAEVLRLVKAHGIAEAARRLGCVPGSVHYHIEADRRDRARAELLAEEKRKKRRRAA